MVTDTELGGLTIVGPVYHFQCLKTHQWAALHAHAESFWGHTRPLTPASYYFDYRGRIHH